MFRFAIFAVCVHTGGLALHGLRTENRKARNVPAQKTRNRVAQAQEGEEKVWLEISSTWSEYTMFDYLTVCSVHLLIIEIRASTFHS